MARVCTNNSSTALGDALRDCKIDPILLDTYRDDFASTSSQALREMRTEARKAWEARQTEVTITSSSFEGGSASGQIEGDPLNVIYILTAIIAEKAGKVSASETEVERMMGHIMDFSRRRVGT